MELFRTCEHCGRTRVLFYEKMGLGSHILLSVLTLGIWLPFWLYLSWHYKTRGECVECGHTDVTLD